MKFLAICFCFALIIGLPVQLSAQLTENFTDSNLTSNPAWIGDLHKFWINKKLELQLNDSNASSSNSSVLYLPSKALHQAEWRFNFRFDFSPSTSNYAKVYLSSDQTLSQSHLNAYYLKLGGSSGSVDDVSLYRQTGTYSRKIIDGTDGLVAKNPQAKIKVTRDSLGLWVLEVDTTLQGNTWKRQGESIDTTHIYGSYFGIECRYTSSRKFGFYFDDISVSGKAIPDSIPPTPVSATLDSNQLTIQFSESLDSLQLVQGVYAIQPHIGITSIDVSEHRSRSVILTLDQMPIDGIVHHIQVSSISDFAGNSVQLSPLKFGNGKPPHPLDVIINEINPNPKIGFVEHEFLELYNRSDSIISLDSCVLSDLSSTRVLDDVSIYPRSFLILCSSSKKDFFTPYGSSYAVSPWPSLNSTYDRISIYCKSRLIHEVEYDSDWFVNWEEFHNRSLELINPNLPCFEGSNWSFNQNSNGATPGRINSLLDTNCQAQAPQLLSISTTNDTSLNLLFDASVQFMSLSATVFSPVIQGLDLPTNSRYTKHLRTSSPLQQQTKYSLMQLKLDACARHLSYQQEMPFGVEEKAVPGDIVINEVLFQPYASAHSEFVELYNASDKVVNLNRWSFSRFNWKLDSLDDFSTLTDSMFYLFPGEHVALCPDPIDIMSHYPVHSSTNIKRIPRLPPLPNDSGTIFLLDNSGRAIDDMMYLASQHHPQIHDAAGVTLERVNPIVNSKAKANWQSASSTFNYGSPGMKNSQYTDGSLNGNRFKLNPSVFSPDNDGSDDLLYLSYSLNQAGWLATISIFDVDGRKIHSICNQEILGTSGSFIWDGSSELNTGLALPGMYLIFFELQHPDGPTDIFKKACVLAVKF